MSSFFVRLNSDGDGCGDGQPEEGSGDFYEPRRAMAALELLDEHYQNLLGAENDELRGAIDRLTSVFKLRLFKALLDIRGYCESVLGDPDRDQIDKVRLAHELADKWERLCPMPGTSSFRRKTADLYSGLEEDEDDCCVDEGICGADYADHWVTEDITLVREALPRSTSSSSSTLSSSGLGFSIAGGTDAPCIPTDNSIFITRITPDGLAHQDGRLRMHDVIVKVNNTSFVNVTHSFAVDTLKRSGASVHLQVKRLYPPLVEQISIQKDLVVGRAGRHHHQQESPPSTETLSPTIAMDYLGFSLHGGINSEVIANDHGVFIQKIRKNSIVDVDGRLRVGDRLLMVQTDNNDYDLTFVDYNQAVEFLSQAFFEPSARITLAVGHVSDRRGGDVRDDAMTKPVVGEVRRILLQRSSNGGFGFNIVGGESGEGIFVSLVLTGGAAELNGKLKRGDQILSVNNIDLRYATHEDAALTLRNAGRSALITVKYCPDQLYSMNNEIGDCGDEDEFKTDLVQQWRPQNGSLTSSHGPNPHNPQQQHSSTTSSSGSGRRRRQFYIRAQFDYDANRDGGLPGRGLNFRRGNILHVTNAADDDWWQARHVDSVTGNEDEQVGIIPSQKRVERKERARMKKVIFSKTSSAKGLGVSSLRTSSPSGSGTLERRKKKRFGIFGKDKRDQQQHSDDSDSQDLTSGSQTANAAQSDDHPMVYEYIQRADVSYARPVVIQGPMKAEVNEYLIQKHPDIFEVCVPHTSRPRNENEIDEKDYYFLNRDEMERYAKSGQFIEFGVHHGNMYATSVDSIKMVAEDGKHCVLDVSAAAIVRLQECELYPIAIFIKTKSAAHIQALNVSANAKKSLDECQAIFEQSNKIEREFGPFFTDIAEPESYSELIERVKAIIVQNSGPHIWLPTPSPFDDCF